MSLRSLLFMPGNNPAMLLSSDILGADCVIYDLEDAVALDEKDAARNLVASALLELPIRASATKSCVRINPVDYPDWEVDLEVTLPSEPDYILLPKANLQSLQLVEAKIKEIITTKQLKMPKLILLIETPEAVVTLEQFAFKSAHVVGLALGGEDLAVGLGVSRTEASDELLYARQKLVMVARAGNLEAYDTPYTDTDNVEGLLQDTAKVKGLGFHGKLSINPRQIKTIHTIFNPTEAQVHEAKTIVKLALQAKEDGLGVFSYKGKMVDLPVIRRAENTLRSAEEWGLL